MLRLTFATGCEPGKWFDRFRENTAHGELVTLDSDDPLAMLASGQADLALTRVPDARVTDEHHQVLLYKEAPGIAVPKDSVYAEVGEDVQAEDVAEEYLNYRIADDGSLDVDKIRESLQVVAANVGIVIAPRPLLKVLSKKQVVHLGYVDDTVPVTTIALVWRKEDDCDAIQDFVGIAKGRTKNSSRQEAPKLSAREKAKAKQKRRAEAGKSKGNGRVSKPLPNRKDRSGQRKRRK